MLSMGKSWNRGGKRGFNKNHNYTNNRRGNRNNRGGGRNNRQNRNPRNDHHGNEQYGDVSPSYEGLGPQEYDYNDKERHYDDNFSDFEEGNDGDNFHDGSGMEYDERNVPIDRPPYGYDRGRQMDERRLAPDSEFRHEMEDRRQWRERGEMGDRQWRDRHEMEDRPQRDRRQMDNRHLGDRGQMEHRHLRDRNETEDHHWREQNEMGDRQFRDRHEMEDRPWRDRGQMEHRHWEGRNEIEERQWGEQDEMVDREWIDNQEQGFDNRGQRQNRRENRYHGHGNRPDNSEFQNRSQSRDRDGYDERRRSWHREEEGIDREHFDGGPFEPNHGERYEREFLEEENRADYRNWPDDKNQAYQQKDDRGSQQRDNRGNQQRDQRGSQQRDNRGNQQRDQRGSQQRDQRGSQQRQSHSSSSSRNGQNKSNNRSRTRSRTRTRSSASKSQMNNGSQSSRNKERRQRGSRGKKNSKKQPDKSGQQSKNLNVLPPGLAMDPSQGLVPGPDLSNLLPGDKPGEVLVLIDPDTGIAMPLTTDNAAMINTIPPGPALNNPPLHIPPAFGVKQPINQVDRLQRSGYDRVRDKYRGGANQLRENNAKNSGFFKNRVVSNLRTKATSFKIQPSKTGGNLAARGRININDKRNLNNKTKQIEKNLKPEVKKPSSVREAKILEEPLTMLPINRDTEDLFKSLIQKRRQELKETKQNEIAENAPFLDDSRHVLLEDDKHSSREEDHFQYHDRSVELHGKNDFYETEQYPHQNSSWDIERPEHIRNQQQDHRRHRNESDYEKSRTDVRDRLDNTPRYDPSEPPRSDGFGRPDHGHVNTHHEKFAQRMPAKERLGFQHGQHEGENASNFGNSDFRKNSNFNDGVDRTVTYEHDNSKSEIYRRDIRYGNDRVENSMLYNSRTDSRSTSGIGESRGTGKQNESPVTNSWNQANKSQNDYYDQNRKNVHDGFNRNKENDRSFSKDDSFVSNRTSYPKETRKTRWAPADETVNQERKVELYDIKNTQTALKRNSSNISNTPPEHKSDTRDSRYRHSSSLSPKRRKYDNDTHDHQNRNQGQGHEKARDTRGKNGDHLQGQDRTVKVTPEKSVNQPQKRGNSLDRDHKMMDKMSPSRRQEQDRDKREHEKISDMDRVNRTLAHASQSSLVAKTDKADKVSPGRTSHVTPSGPSSSGDRKSSGSGHKSDSKPTPPDVLSFQKNQIKTLSSILEVLQNKIDADENRKKKEEKRKAEEMKLKNSALETAKRMHEKASKIIKEPIPGESTMQTVVKDLDPTVVPLLDKMKPRMSKTGAPIPSLLDGMDHLSKLSVEEKLKLAATLPRLAEVADPNKMSLADKIRLLRFIMDTKNQDENPIQIVEESIRGCGLGLTLKYEAHEIKCVAGRPAFTGTLYLSDAFLGRCVGFTKKEIKHNIYEQALNLLKNKTAAEIVAMKDPGIDELRKELVLSIVEDKHKKSELSETESQESKFKKLKQYIQDCKKTHLTPAVFLQKAIELSECHLRSHFYTKRVNLPIGELFFFHKGVLLIDDIVVGLATGHKGKNVKPATYCNAIEAFQTKSVKDILKGIRPLEADVLPPIFVDREKFKISSKKRMEYLVKYLKESQIEDHQEAINKGAKECWLTPLCVYKKPKKQKKWFHCEFFINHLLVGEGEGKEMKDAELEAYNSAWRQLRNVSVETMFENNRKMELADFSDPLIVDVQLKVNFQSVSNTTDCNLAALKRLKFDLNQEGKTKEGLVILEHEEWSVDRKGQSFSILNHSATQNGMFLHWLIQPEGKLFKCAFNLQGECVGEATAPDRNGAKNLAAADALFRLYDSHDVVKITRWDDSKLWTEYWEIKAQALKLAQDESDGKGVDEKGAPKLKWIIEVCQQMIEDYMKKYSLEELIFGPGMPLMERSEVQKLAKKMELKHEMRQQEGNAYLVLSKKMTPQEMATCLHQNGGISGKYSLVPVTQLPKSSSIEQEKRKYKRPGYDKLLEEVEDTKKPRLASDENTGTPSTTRNTFSDSKPVSTQSQGHSNKIQPITNPILFSSASSTVPASTGPITVSKAALPPPGVAIPLLSTQPNYQAVPTQQAPIVAVSQLVSQANVQASSAAYNTPLSYRLPDSVVPQYGAPISRVYTTPASTAVPVQAVTTQPAISSSFVFGLNQTPGIQQSLIHPSVQNTSIVQQQVLNSVASVNTTTLNNQGIYVQGLQPVSQGIKPIIPQPVPPVRSTGVPPVATSLPLQQNLPQVPTSISQYRPPAVQQQSIQLSLNAEHQKLLLIQQEALRKMRAQTPHQAGTITTPQPVQHPHQSVLNRMQPPVTTQQVANQISTAASVANQAVISRTVTPNFSVPPPNFRFPPPAVTYSSVSSNTAGQTQTSSASKTNTTYPFTNKPNLDMLSKPAVTSSIHINLLYKSGQNSTAPSKTQTSSLKTKASEYQKRRQSVLTTIDTSKHLSTDKPGPRSSSSLSSNVSPSHSMTAGVNSSKAPSSTTTTAAQGESPKSNVQQLVEKALKVFGGTAELESALSTIKGITQEQNKSPGSTGGGILDSILKQRAKETKPAPEKNTATLILSNQPGAKSKIIKPAETKQAENKTSENKTSGTKTVETKNVDQTAKPNEKYKKSMLGVSGMLSLMRKQQEKEHKSAYEKFKETVVKPSEKEGKSDEELKDIQTRKQYEAQPSGGSGMKGILKQADRIDSLSTDTHFKHYQKQTANQRTYRQTNRDSPPEKETTPRVEVFPRGKGVNELKVDNSQPKVENNQPKAALKSILKNKSASDTTEQRSEDFTEVNKRNNLYYSQFGFNNKQDSSKSNLGQTQGSSAKGYQQSESAKDTPFWMHKSQGSDIDSEYGRHTEPEIYHTKQSSETNTSFMRRNNEHDPRLSGYRSQFGDRTETYDKEDSSFTKSPVIPGLDYVHQKASDQDHEHLYGYGSRPKPLIDASAYGRQSGSQFDSNRMENKPSEERFNAYDLESLLGNKNKPNVNTSQSNMDNYTQNSADQFGQQATLQKLSETLKNIRDNYDHPDDDYYGNTSNMNRNYPSSSERSSSYNPSFTPQTSRQDGGIGSSSYNPSFSSSLKQQYPFGFGAMNNPPSLQQNQPGYGSSVTPPSRLPGFQGNTMGIPSAIGREYGLPRFSSRQPPPSSSISSTPSYMMDSLDNFTAESRAERKEKRF